MHDKIKNKKLFPNCSTWVGRIVGKKYKEHWEAYDVPKEKKSELMLEFRDSEVRISTDCFPNGGALYLYDLLKDGTIKTLDDLDWSNEGGGACREMLEEQFELAELLYDLDIDLSPDEINALDLMINCFGDLNIYNFEEEEREKVEELLKKVPKQKIEEILMIIAEKSTGATKQLLRMPSIPKKIKDKLMERLLINAI